MKAVVFEEFGKADVLYLADVSPRKCVPAICLRIIDLLSPHPDFSTQ
ncbi:hypothetical protein [Beijerinckia indica]|uniref:Uncharacterized protein n=1 Tax=Beijerinckia indica subsp. indica (strain ATCC 9039 / DSM 1715 / NCIMB 8712) TaxID=395963 RepID=B2IKN9_BEII9|nr:hypothetical protein [Beijerinckia indica]ACB95078.1 hypothetical protein Bind_1438 [Beijerinckia indica subsp. indica ATCC 9039]